MKIDLSSWNRREHYEFYKSFDDPYWGATNNFDVTELYLACKQYQASIFCAYHYVVINAANEIENFRYRIRNDEVWDCERVNVSSVFLRQDKTFAFGFVPFQGNFIEVQGLIQQKIVEIEQTQGLNLDDDAMRDDVAHCSALPWLPFTSMEHAKNLGRGDSCPKISFGKIEKRDSRYSMPISIHVHHGLVDGYHMGLFVETIQSMFDNFKQQLNS